MVTTYFFTISTWGRWKGGGKGDSLVKVEGGSFVKVEGGSLVKVEGGIVL